MNKRVAGILLLLCLSVFFDGCASDFERGYDKGVADGVSDAANKGAEDGALYGAPRGRAAGQSRAKADAEAGFFPTLYLPELIGGCVLGVVVFLPVQYLVLRKLGRLPARLLFLLVPRLEQNHEYQFRASCKKLVQEARLRIFALNLDAHLHAVAMANLRNLTEAVIEHAPRFFEAATLSLHAFAEQVEKLIKSYSVFSEEGRR